jgi:hypothetical protein
MSMSLRRALAAAIYLLAAIAWALAMALSSLLGCEGGCFGDERDRLDASVVLGGIGVSLAVAAFFGSILKRWLGLSFLGLHVVVFAINLGIYWGLANSPSVFIPLAGLAAAAGYVAVGGPALPRMAGRS